MDNNHSIRTILRPEELAECRGGATDPGPVYKFTWYLSYGLSFVGILFIRIYEEFYPLVLK